MKHNSWFEKIYLVKPYVEAGESIGFLPGGVNDKLDPFLASFYINLHQIIGENHTKRLKAEGQIEIIPMAYLRGVTFRNSIVLLDEAQNATIKQMKLFLTRLGEDSKFIITGDVDQSDIKEKSGLSDAIERFNNLERVGVVEFKKSDIVRHPIIERILKRYEE